MGAVSDGGAPDARGCSMREEAVFEGASAALGCSMEYVTDECCNVMNVMIMFWGELRLRCAPRWKEARGYFWGTYRACYRRVKHEYEASF